MKGTHFHLACLPNALIIVLIMACCGSRAGAQPAEIQVPWQAVENAIQQKFNELAAPLRQKYRLADDHNWLRLAAVVPGIAAEGNDSAGCIDVWCHIAVERSHSVFEGRFGAPFVIRAIPIVKHGRLTTSCKLNVADARLGGDDEVSKNIRRKVLPELKQLDGAISNVVAARLKATDFAAIEGIKITPNAIRVRVGPRVPETALAEHSPADEIRPFPNWSAGRDWAPGGHGRQDAAVIVVLWRGHFLNHFVARKAHWPHSSHKNDRRMFDEERASPGKHVIRLWLPAGYDLQDLEHAKLAVSGGREFHDDTRAVGIIPGPRYAGHRVRLSQHPVRMRDRGKQATLGPGYWALKTEEGAWLDRELSRIEVVGP